jgi:uncharacterized OB-fold protein
MPPKEIRNGIKVAKYMPLIQFYNIDLKYIYFIQGHKGRNILAIICPNCGKEAPSDAAFCSYCGASLTAIPPSPAATVEVPISYQIQTATILFDERASRLELIV